MSLLPLAFKNLARKPFRTWALVLAVAIAGGAVFSTATVMWGVERSMKQGLSKFGADLLVIPRGALVNMKTALLTGEPSAFYMNSGFASEVKTIAGVAKVSPQIFLTTADGEHCTIGNAFLVGFDPDTDFTVMPWLLARPKEPFGKAHAIVGGNNGYQAGDTVLFYGQTFTVYGKLDRTGIGLYDNAVFIHIDKAYELADASKQLSDVAALGFARGDISALLVQIGNSSKAGLVRFAVSRNPAVKVVTAGNIVTSVRQNLVALFTGTVVLSIVLVLGNILMISAIFSTIVNERKKELGLLRAIGAKKQAVFRLILSESTLLTAMGGALGILIGAVLMRVYARTIGFHLESLNIPFMWPPFGQIAMLGALSVLLALLVGALGAVWPALAGSRMDPYDAIRAGE
ncbi:MAG: ABC transporter permease [Burkholderiaceae bacterium]|nr:ABC transporter permease [Burkholderiaceae bacterium]